MAPLNKVTRAQAIMRYIHQHPQSNTYESIARDLNLSASSVRVTCADHYPKTFTRDITGSLILSDPIIWPEDTEFDLYQPINESDITPPLSPVVPINDEVIWLRKQVETCMATHGVVSRARESSQQIKQATPVHDPLYLKREWYEQGQRSLVTKIPQVAKTLIDMQDAWDNDKTRFDKGTELADKYMELMNTLKYALITLNSIKANDRQKSIGEHVK